ncbi:unnamed protein product [Heligmosomoides polygyrus]|uniref:C3H1-type domain-containing protein n=1 Tax=Heligmosomoides polygyrus TaxID=6339 RepID=A0A3P7UPT5_HELPZ|nr:unnamed protein product [Heligmosomoides polygyrus]
MRKEHDAQIVQMAVECGLRISPDQWSALLYGDQAHRSHMQSIIDRLQTPHSYMQGIDELAAVADGGDSSAGGCNLAEMAQLLRVFDSLPSHQERISWHKFADYIDALQKLIKAHADFTLKRNEQRAREAHRSAAVARSANSGGLDKAHAYKTKMCKDISARRLCPRGARCTYAHSAEELREASRKDAAANGPITQASNPPPFMPMPQRMMITVPPPSYPSNGSYQSEVPLTSVPPPTVPPPHPAMVPILPVPMLPTGIPRRGMVINNANHHPQSPNGLHSAPHPHSLWNTHHPPPGAMMMPHLNSAPSLPQPHFWMHPPPAVYTFDPPSENGFIWSSSHRPELAIPPPPLQSSRAMDQPADTEQLMMKRNEIINRLAPLTLFDEDDFEDGGVGHVSYTVASSVLDEWCFEMVV